MKLHAKYHLPFVLLTLFGFVVSCAVMIYQLWLCIKFGLNNGLTNGVWMFLESSAWFLLVMVIAWGDLMIRTYKASKDRKVWKSYVSFSPAVIRLRRWLLVFFAWAATAFAGLVLFPAHITLTIIFCLIVFGSAMWRLDAGVTSGQQHA